MLSRILGRSKDPQADEGSKPTIAKMGTKNKMYYNAELKRWVMPGQEAAIAEETAARDAPPPETEGELTPPPRQTGLASRYPIPSFVKTKESAKLPNMLAYSHPLRPQPVADEAVPDAPENIPSAKDEMPPWHAPQPSQFHPQPLSHPSHFAEKPLQPPQFPREALQPSQLSHPTSQSSTEHAQTSQTSQATPRQSMERSLPSQMPQMPPRLSNEHVRPQQMMPPRPSLQRAQPSQTAQMPTHLSSEQVAPPPTSSSPREASNEHGAASQMSSSPRQASVEHVAPPQMPLQASSEAVEAPPMATQGPSELPQATVQDDWDPEAQHESEVTEPVAAWAVDAPAPLMWDPEGQQDEAAWEGEPQPEVQNQHDNEAQQFESVQFEAQQGDTQAEQWGQWQTAEAAPAPVWTNEGVWSAQGNEWQSGMKVEGEAIDACSVISREMPSPRVAAQQEEARRVPSTALPPLMPTSTRRVSAERVSEGTRQDDLHSSSGWDSTRVSNSNIHRASQRATSRKLYRNFASPSITGHALEYRRSRQPSPSVTGLLYHQRRSSSLNRPAMSYDRSRSPPDTPKQGYQGEYLFSDKGSRTANMMSQFAPSVGGDSIRNLQHSRRSTLDTSDPSTRVMHLRIARRAAVNELPARKESEKKDMESMGAIEESLRALEATPEIANYIPIEEARDSISRLLQMESVSEAMKAQLTKLSDLLEANQQQALNPHKLKATRLEKDFESIINSLKLSQRSDVISQVHQLTYRFQDSTKMDLASTGLPTGDLIEQLSVEEESSIDQLVEVVRGLMAAMSEKSKAEVMGLERAGRWTANVLREKDEKIAVLEQELSRERSRADETETASRVEETETASRLREAEAVIALLKAKETETAERLKESEAANSLLREQLCQAKEDVVKAQEHSNESLKFLDGMQQLEERQFVAERMQLEVEKNLMETEIEELQTRNAELESENLAMRQETQTHALRVNAQLEQLLQQAALLDQAADQEIEELDTLRANLLQPGMETETPFDLQTHINLLETRLAERSRAEMQQLEAEFQKGAEELVRLADSVAADKDSEMSLLRDANASLQTAIDKLLRERQQQEETWSIQRQKETETRLQEETERRQREMDGELEKRRHQLEEEFCRRRQERETETRMQEEALAERERELGGKSTWMEAEVQKLAKYALALQSRSAAFSEWQEKALAASKVLQGRMRLLNQKVVLVNRQLAARGAPPIDLSQDNELEATRKFVEEEALQTEDHDLQVASHETKSSLHPSSEIIST